MERLQLSNSMLQLVFDCPTRVTLRLLGRTGTEPNASLECGRRFHEALALYYKMDDDPDRPILDDYRVWCEQHLQSDDRRWWENVAIIFDEYMLRHPLDELPFEVSPDRIEVEFVMPLATLIDRSTVVTNGVSIDVPLDIIGNLDGIVRDKLTGGLYILEHKTTGKVEHDQYAYDPQNSEYLWAAAATLGEPVFGSYVDIIEIKSVPSSDRKCARHGMAYSKCGREHIRTEFVPVARTPAQIERWQSNAIKGGQRLLRLARRAQVMGDEAATKTAVTGEVTGACKFCEYRVWCHTNNRALNLIDTYAPKRELQVEEPNLPSKLRSGLVEADVEGSN